jgi:hypothetical protein
VALIVVLMHPSLAEAEMLQLLCHPLWCIASFLSNRSACFGQELKSAAAHDEVSTACGGGIEAVRIQLVNFRLHDQEVRNEHKP